jgi:hypothetical protein
MFVFLLKFIFKSKFFPSFIHFSEVFLKGYYTDEIYFFECFVCCLLTGSHLIQFESTIIFGLFSSITFKCSSIAFGVTQTICCPFQYLTMFNEFNVSIMSFVVKPVILLMSLIGITPPASKIL